MSQTKVMKYSDVKFAQQNMTIKTFLEPVNCDNLILVSILFDFYFRLVRLKD